MVFPVKSGTIDRSLDTSLRNRVKPENKTTSFECLIYYKSQLVDLFLQKHRIDI